MATNGEKERAIRATIYWAASEVICLFLFFFFGLAPAGSPVLQALRDPMTTEAF